MEINEDTYGNLKTSSLEEKLKRSDDSRSSELKEVERKLGFFPKKLDIDRLQKKGFILPK